MSQAGTASGGGSGGSGIETINTISPDGSGNFTIESLDSSVTITSETNAINLSVPAGAGGIVTIDGDSGSVTGTTVSIKTLVATNGCGSSVQFVGISPNLYFEVTDGGANTLIGSGAGNSSIAGAGTNNVGLGDGVFSQLQTGLYNAGLGSGAGTNYTTNESSNICILNAGTIGESSVIRIGTQGSGDGQQDTCYIAGITGATVTGSPVLCSPSGQLGTISSSQKYKDNIQDIGDSSSSILNLRPTKFTYKSDSMKAQQYGLIAEEVEKVFPDLVLYRDGQPDSVAYHMLPALLLNELIKMKKEIEALQAR